MKKFDLQFLTDMRLAKDEFADSTVASLLAHGFNPNLDSDFLSYSTNGEEIPASFPVELKQYFQTIFKTHSEADLGALDSGSMFFQQHAPLLLACLGFLSLPYCYAAADGAQVLYQSERIRKNPGNRLLETALFVFDVCSPGAFSPSGKALVSIGKVRLMHAAIRYHILKTGKWDMRHGSPINQVDMAGTNMAFSLIAIRGLRKLGVGFTAQESWPYIALWNHVGYLGGIRPSLIPSNSKEAFVLEKNIVSKNFRPSVEGQTLTEALSDHMEKEYANGTFKIPVQSIMAYLLDEPVSKMLGLKYSKVTNAMLASTQGLMGLRSVFANIGTDNYTSALKHFEKQTIGKSLKPFRLLHNLRD